MNKIYKKARAKINLTLNVLDKREDNYHNIDSVFQKVSLYDEIYVSKTNKHDDIRIETNVANLEGENNIIYKAYQLLKNKYIQIKGVDVVLKKNIPVQAGLGGGSTDCGGFIECMNKLFDLKLSRRDMQDIGAKLGADVPSTFYNTPIIARGIGEKIEEIKSNAKLYILIIKPEFSCNTKEMYEKLDKGNSICQKYNTEIMRRALEEGDIIKIANNLYNVFETAVEDIENIKNELLSVGAIGSLMSGSGSAVYGIFENKNRAKIGYETMKSKYRTYYCVSYKMWRKE